MNEPHIVTLGCRLNTFESEVIRQIVRGARRAGVADSVPDTVVVNTCAVTAEATRQARQTIRRLRRERPHARIIVTGCAAQLDPQGFAAMPEVDRVLGNQEKLDRKSFGEDGARVQVSDIMAVRRAEVPPIARLEGRTRAFVQVQQGCDHRCTFCIIPFARGPNRSLPGGAIVEQVRRLVRNGHPEVVLTGVDVSSYGLDLPGRPTLGALARRILEDVPELRRLRLSSLDPARAHIDLFGLLADEPRFMPHLHLSLQAANDMVLKRMKRRHSRADAEAFCRRARAARPDVVFGADLIAGFPTETETMFADTLSAVEDLGLTYLHVFPFSPRPGTPAARMPKIAAATRRGRAARLRAAGERARHRFLAGRVGAEAEILVEKGRSGRLPPLRARRFGLPCPGGGHRRGADHRRRPWPARRNPHPVSEEEGDGWLGRLKAGLGRSSVRLKDGITELFTQRRPDAETLEALEDLLIAADLGVGAAARLRQAVGAYRFAKEDGKFDKDAGAVLEALAAEVTAVLEPVARPLEIDRTQAPHVILVCGVNGSGKTTTIAKLAKRFRGDGLDVWLAAGDTFRAAAVEQLQVWGERTGCPVIAAAPGADAAGLAYEALEKAAAESADVLLIDTAGRLHNKADLMAELQKIVRAIKKLDPSAPHDCLIVMDATTGQNALNQVAVFSEMVDATGLIVTKLDGSARGGVVVALAEKFAMPVHAVGVGESMQDLRPFEARSFARSLLGLD